MEKVHEKNLKTKKKPNLSCTKLLCAAGLALCDFTNTEAAKAEGYSHLSSHSPSSDIFVPVIEQNKISNDADLDPTANSVTLGSDLIETSNHRPNIPHDVKRGPATHHLGDSVPVNASKQQPQPHNRSDHLSITSNGSIDTIPRPPPPVWIRDNRYEQPQTNNLQSIRRQDDRITSESIKPPAFSNYLNTKKNKRDSNPNARRDDQSTPTNFAAQLQQRRVPLHLQPAQQRQNFYHTQQHTDVVPSKSNPGPRVFRSVAPTQSHDGYSPENYPNNRHVRSYQSRIMDYHSEHQNSVPEPKSNDRTRTGFKEPLNRDKWSLKGNEDQRYNQFTVNQGQGRSSFRSLRDPTVNQYTRGTGSPMKNKSQNNSEMGRGIDDPNNAIVSLVPGPSSLQLATMPPSLHDALMDDQINQVRTYVCRNIIKRNHISHRCNQP